MSKLDDVLLTILSFIFFIGIIMIMQKLNHSNEPIEKKLGDLQPRIITSKKPEMRELQMSELYKLREYEEQ